MSRGSLVLLVLELVGYLGWVDNHLLSPPVFFFPLAQEQKRGPLLSCVVLSPSPLFSTCLGLGISHAGLSFSTGIRRELRPHPPLALRALDFYSILFRC